MFKVGDNVIFYKDEYTHKLYTSTATMKGHLLSKAILTVESSSEYTVICSTDYLSRSFSYHQYDLKLVVPKIEKLDCPIKVRHTYTWGHNGKR